MPWQLAIVHADDRLKTGHMENLTSCMRQEYRPGSLRRPKRPYRSPPDSNLRTNLPRTRLEVLYPKLCKGMCTRIS